MYVGPMHMIQKRGDEFKYQRPGEKEVAELVPGEQHEFNPDQPGIGTFGLRPDRKTLFFRATADGQEQDLAELSDDGMYVLQVDGKVKSVIAVFD